MSSFYLDHSKTFPHLPRAPIVEALLHWQSAATVEVPPDELKQQLETEFSDYQLETQQNFETALAGTGTGVSMRHTTNWDGFRLTKPNNEEPVFVCQFKPSGLVFSRLAPYEGWGSFSDEALRFWEVFERIFKPAAIAGLSTRYISQITIKSIDEAAQYLEFVPKPVLNFTSETFYYQDSASLDDAPYNVHVGQAVQPGQTPADGYKVLIVDIRVSTSDEISEFNILPDRFRDLRFIKNEVFFSVMKDAEKMFGAEN